MKNFKFKWLLLSIVLSIASINTMWGTARTFKSGEKIYFKDTWKANGNSSTWKTGGDGETLCAYFYGDGDGWYKCYDDDNVYGNWNEANTIYEITVPGSGKNFTHVVFTRGKNDPYAYDKWANCWNKTMPQAPDEGYNIFYVNNSTTWNDNENKYNGTWGRYAHNAALVGEFNNWNPDTYPLSNSGVKGVLVTLPASTTYKFKILLGETYYGLDGDKKITSTLTSWWTFYSGQGDVNIQTDVAGDYGFAWNGTDKTVTVYYPIALYPKSKYIYFDVRNETYWNANLFTARFYLKYFDSGSNLDGMPLTCSSPIEDNVYYAVVPDNGYIGQIQMNRWYNNAVDGVANIAYVYNRSTANQNCLKEQTGNENNKDSWTPQWTTYCPPTTSESFTDNGTSKIAWQDGGNDGSASGKAILVKTGTSLKVSASASKAVADNDMTVKYDFKVNSGSTSTKTTGSYTSTASTNNTQYAVNVQMYTNYNLDNTKSSTKHSHTIYYKALDTYSLTHTLTNVTKSEGRTGADAAAYYLPYTATYDAATGYNLPTTITVKFGETIKTAGEDYTWTQATGVLSIPADKIDGNVTVIINGVAKTYSITLDDNGEYEGDGTATATYNTTTLTEISAPTRTGYHVTGYYTSDGSLYIADAYGNLQADKSGYTDGSSRWTKDDVATLYAHWEANTHSLSWNANGGDELTGSYTSGTTAYGTTIVKPNTPTQSGYVFKGWAESESGAVVSVPATMPDADKSYYAQWLDIDDVASTCWDGSGNYLCGSITNLATPKPGTTTWGTAANWGNGLPTLETQVVIPANMAMTVDVANAKAKEVILGTNATLAINPTGGLVIATTISKADGSATTPSDLAILSSSSGNGAFITGEASSTTQAAVQFYTKAMKTGAGYINQFIGVPLAAMTAYNGFYGTSIRVYNATEDKWEVLGNNAAMYPFTAYNLMRKEESAGTMYMEGALNLPGVSGTKTLNMGSRIGDYLFANSWTAPIDVKTLLETDFSNAEATIYIFNAGTSADYDTNGGNQSTKKHDNPGQWLYMPIDAVKASQGDFSLTVIPSMQAFMVKSTAANATLTLNYDTHVYTPAKTSGATIVPSRAPRNDVSNAKPEIVRVRVEGTSGYADDLLLFLGNEFSDGYDNGWEAYKVAGKAYTPQLYAVTGDGRKAISAQPDADNTVIGFKAGTEDDLYTFTLDYEGDNTTPLYLYDTQTEQYTRVEKDATYMFLTNDNEDHPRFVLTRYNAPQVTTGVDDVQWEGSKARKLMIDCALYIIRDGRIYNAEGALVK